MGKPHTEEAVLDYSAYFNKCHSNGRAFKTQMEGEPRAFKANVFLCILKTTFDPPHTTHTEETDNSAHLILKDEREHHTLTQGSLCVPEIFGVR